MGKRKKDKGFMEMAIEEAKRAGQSGEVPVGAVLVKEDQVLSRDHNRCIEMNDPTAHAEMLVLRKAGEVLKNYRLNHTVMYITTEPCAMCASAMIHARVSRLVYGASEPKFGAVESKFRLLEGEGLNHRMEVNRGILEKECAKILKDFFKERRT